MATHDPLSPERASYAGHKSHLTRTCNAAHDFLRGLPANPAVNSFIQDTLNRFVSKAEAQLQALERLADEIIRAEPERTKRYTDDMLDLGARWAAINTEIGAILAQPQAPQPQGQGPPQRMRPIEALKPFELDITDGPTKLRVWEGQFEAYFRASQLHLAGVEEQQAFFFRGLSTDLATLLRADVAAGTPIFGPQASCFSALRSRFNVRYPLVQRRSSWFRLRRREGESVTSWYAKFRELAIEADLGSLTVDELLMFGIVSNVEEPVLSDRILRLEQPTLAAVEREISAFEISLNARETEKRHFIAAVNTNRKPCYRCGRRDHDQNDCPFKEATCDYCKKKGHIATVCRAKRRDKGKPNATKQVSEVVDHGSGPPPPQPVMPTSQQGTQEQIDYIAAVGDNKSDLLYV